MTTIEVNGISIETLVPQFDWYANYIRILGHASYGGIWIAWNFQLGKYQIQCSYKNQLAKKKMLILVEGWTEINGFWTGEFITPPVNLHLR